MSVNVEFNSGYPKDAWTNTQIGTGFEKAKAGTWGILIAQDTPNCCVPFIITTNGVLELRPMGRENLSTGVWYRGSVTYLSAS